MKHRIRIITAGMLGNLIETFDMAICRLLSMYLAKYLIGNETKGPPIVFTTFFAGYLARPVGAMVSGARRDPVTKVLDCPIALSSCLFRFAGR